MKKILLLCGLLSMMAIAGCGETSGSTTELRSVYLTTSPSTGRLEADMVTGNSCVDEGSSTGGTYTTESIPVTITSTAYPKEDSPSPVTIRNVKISYSKYSQSARTLNNSEYDTTMTINPGESKILTVNVAPDKLKLDMVDKYAFNLCSLDYWEYYVTITFDALENFSGRTKSFSTDVKVAFADRNNK